MEKHVKALYYDLFPLFEPFWDHSNPKGFESSAFLRISPNKYLIQQSQEEQNLQGEFH